VREYYSTQLPDGPVDDVIIGSGMGGMVLAGLLTRFGRKVCVLEQHYVPGGVTHSFRRRELRFNIGVHLVGDVAGPSPSPAGLLLSELCEPPVIWDSLGDHYDRVEFPDESFDIPSTEDGFRAALKERFPDETSAVDKYFELIRRATFVSIQHFIYKSLPWHGRRAMWLWLRRPSRDLTLKTTDEVVCSLTQDKRLRRLLTAQWGYHGTPPQECSFVAHAQVTNHFFQGGHYPRGGGSIFAERLLRPVVARGGTVSIRARVTKILFSGRKTTGVQLENGRIIHASRVFSDAGAHTTAHLMADERLFSPWLREVNSFKSTCGHVTLFLGLDEKIEELRLSAKNLWVYSEAARDLKSVDNLPYPTESFDPAGFWFSFVSAKDQSHQPSARGHCAQLITFVPSTWFTEHFGKKRGRRGSEYEALKNRLQEGLLRALEHRFAGITAHITHAELSTPASTHTFTARPCGSIYGLAATPERFWSPRFGTRTPSPNLFLTGADSAMVGVMGAIAGALLAAFAASPFRTLFFLLRALTRSRRKCA
jgi:all-trans-retinol 13,14-reductase